MAGDTIDRMGDTTTTAGDRAIRKRGLLDGPKSSTACALIAPSAATDTTPKGVQITRNREDKQ